MVRDCCILPKVTTLTGISWAEALAGRIGLEPGGTWLSLGCGSGATEAELGRKGLFDSLAAFDASPESLRVARAAAETAGLKNVSYELIDLNDAQLPESRYDVVMVEMALHHVREIETLLKRIAASLRPRGIFLLNEFVGPRQFQFSERQLDAVREFLRALPPRLRNDSCAGGLKLHYARPTLQQMNETDPSEAVRSDSILPEVYRIFDVIVRADYGGAVLMPLLEHIVHNFDPDSENDVTALRLLSTAEDLLVRYGVLPSDFAMLAARNLEADAPRRPSETRTASPFETPEQISALRAERDALASQLSAIERSRSWFVLQALRRLLGRAW